LFFATQSMFVYFWSSSSDRVGRKPILLIGLGGLCLSMVSFGLSKTFSGLVISRCLAGMLNGNVGVMKTMVSEISDPTNIAEAFGYIPVVWSVGGTIGPFAGGALARPYGRFPNVFGQRIWKEYPYLLPCLFSASVSALAFMAILGFLKETVNRSRNKVSTAGIETRGEDVTTDDGPLPLRKVMTGRVILSIACYSMLAFTEICYLAVQPLYFSTYVEDGGLGLDAATIGICLGTFGLLNGVIQVLVFAKLVKRFGAKTVFVVGMMAFVPLIGMFPVINLCARAYGVTWKVWVFVIIQLLIQVVMDMSFGCAFIFLSSSVTNKRSLGSVNGVGQTTASIARTIGPATATSLFAFSLQNQLLGGNAVYLVLVAFSFVGLFCVLRLPRQPWAH